MTNDTAMTKQESEVMIEQLKKIFEVVRLLDGDALETGNLKDLANADGFPCKCYDFWKKGTRCKNCTSKEALQKKEKLLKLEYLNSNIYQVISKYVEIDGKPYVMELINAMKSDAIMDDDGRTELIKQLSGYNRELYTDALTGIYNRRYYEERIKNFDMTAGIAMIDLDDFKIYNDTFGHDAGDLALTTVVGIVKANIRRTDMLIRMGGDEFLLVMPDITDQIFADKLKQIQEKIHDTKVPGYSQLRLSVSIGKLAHGIADDMLTTTIMACKCKKIVSPAMNTNMYENPIVQDNLAILQHYGYEVIEPASGYLACGDTGAGKMPEPEMLLDYILREIAKEKDLLGRKVLVTAGPTQEAIDPVRYITNHSSGKMGYALAKAAMLRGADVTLVSGPCAIEPPPFVKLVPVVTAKEMFDAVTSVSFEQDIIIKAAAVADYRPANVYEDKVKKHEEQMSIKLEKTDDILGYLGEHRLPGQFLCGFSMETQNMLGNSRAKLGKKHLDMVAANNLKVAGAGFQGDTNVLTLITQDEDVSLQLMSKEDAANVILDKILSIQKEREEQ